MKDKKVCIRVFGRVQGVFFRAFTLQEARARGLRGYVTNCPDGSVYMEAEGDEDNLRELIERVKNGPPAARVRDIKIDWCEPVGYADFQIRY